MVNSLEQEGFLKLTGSGSDRTIITLNEEEEI